jgi:threonine dehydrogenase-like Zn-dependent dehydrogenase
VEDPDWAGQVDLALECSGHEQAALQGCRIVRKKGEVVLIGAPWRRRTDLWAHDILTLVFHRYVVLRSGWEWELPHQSTDFRTGSLRANYAAALEWLADGRVSAAGLDTLYPPSRAQEAYETLLQGRLDRLAVVFDWREEAA